MREDKTVGGKVVIESLEDINAYIDKSFPGGLETKRKTDFFKGGAFIGFNLCRYAYTDELAAECHAMREIILDNVGKSYGCPFESYVETKKREDGQEWYTVVTGPYQDAPA